MKTLFKNIAYTAVLLTLVTSCGNTKEHNHNHAGVEHTAQYVCPMHCEGAGGDSAGQCPVCGMDYIKNPDYKPQDSTQNIQTPQ